MTRFQTRLCALSLALSALALASCAGSTNYTNYSKSIADIPTHVKTCPSTVQLKQYARLIQKSTTDDERSKLAQELTVALRRSELKQNRCLKQALSYYEKIRAKRAGKK